MHRICPIFALIALAASVTQAQLIFQAVDDSGQVLGPIVYAAGGQQPTSAVGVYAVADIDGEEALFAVPQWDANLGRFERESIYFETSDCTGQAYVNQNSQGFAVETHFVGPLLAIYRVQDARETMITTGSILIQNGGVCNPSSSTLGVLPVELISMSFLAPFSGPFHLEPVLSPTLALPVPAVNSWGLALLALLLVALAITYLRHAPIRLSGGVRGPGIVG